MISTVLEAYEYVLQGLQKEGAATLDPQDFMHFWNAAQLNFVRRRYRETDLSEERMQDLRVLIPPPLPISNSGSSSNQGEIFSLPARMMFVLSLCQRVVGQGSGNSVVPAPCAAPDGCSQSRPIKRDQRYEVKRDPFWSPSVDEPYHFLTENSIRTIVPAPYWTDQIVLEYLKEPRLVVLIAPGNPNNVDPELPPHVNQIIADDVVRSRIENIQSGRMQTLPIEQRISNSNNA